MRICAIWSLVRHPAPGSGQSVCVIFHPIRLVGRLLIPLVIVATGLVAVGTVEAERMDSGAPSFAELPSQFLDQPGETVAVVRDRMSVGMDQILDRGAGALID